MPSGDVWLHPLHTAANADTITFVPISMQRKIPDVQELHSFVSELALAHQVGSTNSGHEMTKRTSLIWRVCLTSGGMMITREGETRVHSQPILPLLFCELVHVSVGRQQLIAIGRRHQSKEIYPRSLTGPYKDVWVLTVDGDEDALHSIVGAISALGAIRADLLSVYQLSDSPIGTGACSVVYLGTHLRPDVKTELTQTILSERLNKERPNAIAAKVFKSRPDRDVSEMVIAEAAHLLAVQAHPNIVSYYGTLTMPAVEVGAPVSWVMALECCSGGELYEYIVKYGALKETHAAEMLVGVLAALVHVHSCGIVHRDVKAENILLDNGGSPILADFGISARVNDEEAMLQRCGSPGFVAPEILNGQKYDCKVDVFSAGVVLYFLLYATLPFTGPNIGTILRRNARGTVKIPECCGLVSNDMTKVVLKLLQNEHENRIDSKSAVRLVWSGWCRDRVLPRWLHNRDHEFLGSSPFESETSPHVEVVACNSSSSSEGSSTDFPAGVASALVEAETKEISGAETVELARAKIQSIQQAFECNSSDVDEQLHQSVYCSDGTRSTAGGTSRCQHSDRIRLTLGCSTDSSFGDSALSERISEASKQNVKNCKTIEKPKSLSGTFKRFWRRGVRTYPKRCAMEESCPFAADVAEAPQSLHSSLQPRPPRAPKKNNVQRSFFGERVLFGAGGEQPGRRIFKPQMRGPNEGPSMRSGESGQEHAGMHDEPFVTDMEHNSDRERLPTQKLGSKQDAIERTASVTRGWRSEASDDSDTARMSLSGMSRGAFSNEHVVDDATPGRGMLGEKIFAEGEVYSSSSVYFTRKHAETQRKTKMFMQKLPFYHKVARCAYGQPVFASFNEVLPNSMTKE